MRCLAFAAYASAAVAAPVAHPSVADLRRAIERKPGPDYQGQGDAVSMSRTLNGHLRSRSGLHARECDKFSVEELQALLRRMSSLAEPQLLAIYAEQQDR